MQKLINDTVAIDLDRVRIASPCKVSWDSMTGNDQVRFCGDCKKNVFNISAMSRAEAQLLLAENSTGSLCIRMYKRFDGTVLTDDCPVGLRRLRNTARRLTTAAAGFLSIFISALSNNANAQGAFIEQGESQPPLPSVQGRVNGDYMMGGMRPPPPQEAQDPQNQKSVSATIVSYRTRWLSNHRRHTEQAQRLVAGGHGSNSTPLRRCEQMLRGTALDAERRQQPVLSAISNNNAANCLYYQGKLGAACQLYQTALNALNLEDDSGNTADLALPILENAMLVENELNKKSSPKLASLHAQLTHCQIQTNSIGRAGVAWLHTEHGGTTYTKKATATKSSRVHPQP